MGKIMAVDFGKRRCGIAVTDDMKIIASGLETVETQNMFPFCTSYFNENNVEAIVIGLPTDLKGNMSEIEQEILKFIEKFKIAFPAVEVHRFDERFTSKMASYFISQSGKSKKKREEKGLIDKVSATLILQNFLEQQQK
ncbi:Holliday junction resolvase RuvX [Chryseobacterium sp.]|uniref:Holliday junction resolvase RuvX n=1 Tax=Chryseobacterium sp. TaxID=1871047 RepID=UPI0011CC5F3E|nr:Holliday junction resolvase RuvX [Chryseobacterium sp.]TXF77437.1 Holliday junction resolvase RuvX [Chryseobacterium sp.]